MRFTELLCATPAGIYCPPGDFYIDPTRPVERALITHGHSDHARRGHGAVLATQETLKIMAERYGEDFAGSDGGRDAGRDAIEINGVSVTFHPAGHVLGSAQIAVEKDGMRIVASGDYKRRPDPTCAPFEPVKCDVFITEATFALPVFRHPDDRAEIKKLLASVAQFPERTHLVGAYALGKAQRVIALIREAGYDAPIYIHGALQKLCDLYAAEGIDLGVLEPATLEKGRKNDFAGDDRGRPALGASPTAGRGASPIRSRASPRAGCASASAPSRAASSCRSSSPTTPTGTSSATRSAKSAPQEVWVTHGREEALVRWCELQGIPAKPLHLMGYEDEAE